MRSAQLIKLTELIFHDSAKNDLAQLSFFERALSSDFSKMVQLSTLSSAEIFVSWGKISGQPRFFTKFCNFATEKKKIKAGLLASSKCFAKVSQKRRIGRRKSRHLSDWTETFSLFRFCSDRKVHRFLQRGDVFEQRDELQAGLAAVVDFLQQFLWRIPQDAPIHFPKQAWFLGFSLNEQPKKVVRCMH